MGEKGNLEDLVKPEELLLANTIEHEALVNILVKKGLIDKDDLLDEIKKVKKEIYSKLG